MLNVFENLPPCLSCLGPGRLRSASLHGMLVMTSVVPEVMKERISSSNSDGEPTRFASDTGPLVAVRLPPWTGCKAPEADPVGHEGLARERHLATVKI